MTTPVVWITSASPHLERTSAPEIVRAEVIVQGLNYVEPEARVNLGDIQRMLDWYEAQGMQKIHIDAKTIVDMRYVKLIDEASKDEATK